MNDRSKDLFKKIVIYILILFSVAIIESIPGLFQFGMAKPNLLLTTSIAIAMYEHELVGGLLGAFAGLLWDTTSIFLFGMGGFFYLIFSVSAALGCIYLLSRNYKNHLCITAVFSFVFSMACYFFGYRMWGYSGASIIIMQDVIPTTLLTTLFAPICFMIVSKVALKFADEQQ